MGWTGTWFRKDEATKSLCGHRNPSRYGLLRWVMEEIRESASLELQVIATGMHLSPEFGLTYRDIEADGFQIDRKVEMLMSADTPSGIAKSMGLALIGFADAYAQLKPDLLLILEIAMRS